MFGINSKCVDRNDCTGIWFTWGFSKQICIASIGIQSAEWLRDDVLFVTIGPWIKCFVL